MSDQCESATCDEDLDQGRVKPTGFWSPAGLEGVPNEAIRIGKPVAYASTIMPCPITIATCPGEVVVPSDPAKKTRSPGCSWPGATFGPHVHCSSEVRGMLIPTDR